jgi:hypothetical protein
LIALRLAVLPLAACALLLGGCGLTSSPAQDLTFSPPPGWKGSPGIMGFMQFWRSPDSDREVLMLFRSPKQLDAHDVFTNARLKDERIVVRRPITICGKQPAMYMKGEASSQGRTGRPDRDVEMIMTNTGGASYFAMYTYPLNERPDRAALAALRELCAKP